MKNEYPEEQDLKLIEEWNIKDVVDLLSFIEGIWWMPDWGFIQKWGKDGKAPIIYLELHTGGWSGNEDIIESLLRNWMFNSAFYTQWNRGGHYRFKIPLMNIGYKSANELTIENKVSRQSIHRSNKYERLKVSDRCILFRKKH